MFTAKYKNEMQYTLWAKCLVRKFNEDISMTDYRNPCSYCYQNTVILLLPEHCVIIATRTLCSYCSQNTVILLLPEHWRNRKCICLAHPLFGTEMKLSPAQKMRAYPTYTYFHFRRDDTYLHKFWSTFKSNSEIPFASPQVF
jgi:hypothetical protein